MTISNEHASRAFQSALRPVELDTIRVGRCLLVSGELDAMSAPKLHRDLATLEGAIDAIDISGIRFIDSTGVRALLTIRRRYPDLPIERPTEMTRRLLTVLGIGDLFDTAS